MQSTPKIDFDKVQLLQAIKSNLIVLCLNSNGGALFSGVVINDPFYNANSFKQGDSFIKDRFKVFNGKIILENE